MQKWFFKKKFSRCAIAAFFFFLLLHKLQHLRLTKESDLDPSLCTGHENSWTPVVTHSTSPERIHEFLITYVYPRLKAEADGFGRLSQLFSARGVCMQSMSKSEIASR